MGSAVQSLIVNIVNLLQGAGRHGVLERTAPENAETQGNYCAAQPNFFEATSGPQHPILIEV